jgi:CRP/FNR family cyclic AMP-dependent transcriptional regulator
MESTHIDRIDDLELFADCRKAELRQIQPLTTYLHVPKDQVLMRAGDPPWQFIILGGGTARLTRQTDGGVSEMTEVGGGEFIGESALLAGTRTPITATATTDLRLFVSSANEFRSILRIAPSVEHKLRQRHAARHQGSDAA